MKPWFLIFLLLIPFAHAQLDARKASLDLNANEFILQMNLIANESDLNTIKTEFHAKLNEALQTTTLNDLKAKESEMKKFADDFKSIVKTKFKDTNLRVKIISLDRTSLKEKETKLSEEKRKLLLAAYDKRIEEINAKIEENKQLGKEPGIQALLLKKFVEAKSKLNETDFTQKGFSIDTNGIVSGTVSAAKSLFNFFINKLGEMK